MRRQFWFALCWLLTIGFARAAAHADEALMKPIARQDVRFDEREGVIALEAEHFVKQTASEKRAWHISSSKAAPEVRPDGDSAHVA